MDDGFCAYLCISTSLVDVYWAIGGLDNGGLDAGLVDIDGPLNRGPRSTDSPN
jgi:hypothetical protein